MYFNCRNICNYKTKFQNNILVILFILICLHLNLSDCLYEDQIGKFDWKRSFVGKPKFAGFDQQSIDRIVIATDENVLTVLSAKNGDILWRRSLEKSSRGDIKLLHIQQMESVARPNADPEIITVSGSSPAMIRGWNPSTGNLQWEWSLMPNTQNYSAQSDWFYDNLYLYHVVAVTQSHIEVTAYYATTGQQIKSTTTKYTAPWITETNCVLAAPFYACVHQNKLLAIDLAAEKAEVIQKTLSGNSKTIKILKGAPATVIIDQEIISLKNINRPINIRASPIIFNQRQNDKNLLLRVSIENNIIRITSDNFETGQKTMDIDINTIYSDSLGIPDVFDVRCKNVKYDEQSTAACRILLSTEDDSIVLIQQGKIKWIREEALTKIVAVEMIDLPLSDSEGAIENELKNKDGDVIGALVRRISSQIIHFRNLILTVFGLGAPPSASQKAGLIRDAFGLHKMIVIATSSGKIYGIDNISGKHHWVKYLPKFRGFSNEQPMKILVQRSSKHFPYPAQCAIVGKNLDSENGIIYQFNPISGQSINGGIISLDYEIQQAMLLHLTDSDFCRGILLFDKQNQVHVVPNLSSEMAHSLYLYAANKSTGIVSGYYIEYLSKKLIATPIWQISLGGSGNAHRITNLASKNPIEHVHSQGRVLSDRSVLYKYINPNLVAIATQGPDPIHKSILNVHLIDVVSGNIVSSLTHRRVRDPVHMIHSENWLVYSYYNEKLRRTEITTIELYEGKTQTNSTVWSSLDAPPLPMVERQSFIIPANVVSIKETITEKGITNKHVLIALSNGGIIEMPWAFLDPRRPSLNYNQAREEGIIPYIPELQMPSENVINYNQSVTNLKGIYTAPSGLESTCLIVAYGLDLFVTRLAPSKTFDLLKEDFDYILISAVLAGLTIASIIVKHLSSRKAIKQAWK